jgi:hypothetical protein
MLRINEIARCLNLLSLLAHLCKQAIERGEHLLVIEVTALLLASASASGSRSGTVVESTVAGIGLAPPGLGGLPRMGVMTANVFRRSPRAASRWLMSR